MNPIIFLILMISLLVFGYKIQERMPKEIGDMFSRLTSLLPSFEGEKADIRSMIFCLAVMVFIIVMFKIIF